MHYPVLPEDGAGVPASPGVVPGLGFFPGVAEAFTPQALGRSSRLDEQDAIDACFDEEAWLGQEHPSASSSSKSSSSSSSRRLKKHQRQALATRWVGWVSAAANPTQAVAAASNAQRESAAQFAPKAYSTACAAFLPLSQRVVAHAQCCSLLSLLPAAARCSLLDAARRAGCCLSGSAQARTFFSTLARACRSTVWPRPRCRLSSAA
jgi:hypothetical protein